MSSYGVISTCLVFIYPTPSCTTDRCLLVVLLVPVWCSFTQHPPVQLTDVLLWCYQYLSGVPLPNTLLYNWPLSSCGVISTYLMFIYPTPSCTTDRCPLVVLSVPVWCSFTKHPPVQLTDVLLWCYQYLSGVPLPNTLLYN